MQTTKAKLRCGQAAWEPFLAGLAGGVCWSPCLQFFLYPAPNLRLLSCWPLSPSAWVLGASLLPLLSLYLFPALGSPSSGLGIFSGRDVYLPPPPHHCPLPCCPPPAWVSLIWMGGDWNSPGGAGLGCHLPGFRSGDHRCGVRTPAAGIAKLLGGDWPCQKLKTTEEQGPAAA